MPASSRQTLLGAALALPFISAARRAETLRESPDVWTGQHRMMTASKVGDQIVGV